MLFNFNLTPLKDVQPWGQQGEKHLSWFGLTDGEYWVQVGDKTLFEYSEDACRHFHCGSRRYCDYQVVRLYEDLMAIAPYVLEVVPDKLIPYILREDCRDWQTLSGRLLETKEDDAAIDDYWEVIEAAFRWVENRRLDTLYLSPSANIYFWSDATHVHFEWDNREKLVNGVPAWTALYGTYCLSREEFIAEVKSFHTRLMEQMGDRVKQVLAGALSPDIAIDLDWLQREQKERSRSIDGVFLGPSTATDWQAVQSAINEIERDLGGQKI